MRSVLGHSAFVIALMSLPGVAAAHEFWLMPSSYRPTAGDTVAVSAWVGTGFQGVPKPYQPNRVVRFELHNEHPHDLSGLAQRGDSVMARFVAGDGQGAQLAYESDFALVTLDGQAFDRYLAEEGLDAALAARRGAPRDSVRERYARCAKSWIAGASTNPRATLAVGLTYELVPDRAVSEPRTPLRIRVLFKGSPVPGALVRAWNHPLAEGARPLDPATRASVVARVEARTDREGWVSLLLDRGGEWLVSSVHMTPAPEPGAEWKSYWASLTFARGGP